MTSPELRTCAKCGGPRDRGRQRYCRACHAAYMRDWRKTLLIVPREKAARLSLADIVAGVQGGRA